MRTYIIFGTFLAIFLSGCLAKSVNAQDVYSLKYTSQNTKSCESTMRKSVFVKADSLDDAKFIFLKDGDKISKIGGARFDAFYTDMIAKMMIGALSHSCEFSPSGARIASDMQLDLRVLDFYTDKEEAKISLLFTLTKVGVVVKTGVVYTAAKVKDDNIKSIVKAFNQAANDSVDKVIARISSK